MRVFAFAATNHRESINKKLIDFTADLLKKKVFPTVEVETADLIDYELPIYGQDREKEEGIPQKAQFFYDKIKKSDALIISLAEHNGSFTAVYKNLFDWTSRIQQDFYANKPMIVMATSSGARGGANVLKAFEIGSSFLGINIKAKISVPKFQENFNFEKRSITNLAISIQIEKALHLLKS